MEQSHRRGGRSATRRWIVAAAIAVVAVAAAWLYTGRNGTETDRQGPAAVPVITTLVEGRDVPVTLHANGTATPLQSVEIRAQITSTVRAVHIREGQDVRAGDLLFTLDARAEQANLRKAEAQLEKDRADLAIAQRNLQRQRELFAQKFISQSALDAAQNQVDALTAQIAVDRALAEAARVAIAYTQIRAPFAGRTGAINVRVGSLVQPNTGVLVTITQIDPMSVAFALPERELAPLREALAAGPVQVHARVQGATAPIVGRVVFVDNTVDPATATIRVKAEFANPDARLWPGMFVSVSLAPRVLKQASVVPSQAVQTGPENQFVFVVGPDNKVTPQPVTILHVEEGKAAVEGVKPGVRIVVEGAQNLRPGSLVTEAGRSGGGGGKAGNGTGGNGGNGNGRGAGAGVSG